MLIVEYLDSEHSLKENPATEKPVKKARGGFPARNKKVTRSSVSNHATRVRSKLDDSQAVEEDVSRHSSPSKAGDISFVLNAPTSPLEVAPSKSTNAHPQTNTTPVTNTTTPGFAEHAPTFTSTEPTHNRNPWLNRTNSVRTRPKKRKVVDHVPDDYTIDPWDEPDEAGYSEEEARRKLVQKEIRRRVKRESKKRRCQRVQLGALSRGIPFTSIINIEWSFIEKKLHFDMLLDLDRLESGSLNEDDGGEECEAILTALRRAGRRTARPLPELKRDEDVEMKDDNQERTSAGGKTLSQLRLGVNGH